MGSSRAIEKIIYRNGKTIFDFFFWKRILEFAMSRRFGEMFVWWWRYLSNGKIWSFFTRSWLQATTRTAFFSFLSDKIATILFHSKHLKLIKTSENSAWLSTHFIAALFWYELFSSEHIKSHGFSCFPKHLSIDEF